MLNPREVNRALVLAVCLGVGFVAGCSADRGELAEPTVEDVASGEETAAEPDCSNQAVWDAGFESDYEMLACAGGFAKVGVPHTSNGGIVQWDGEKWETVQMDEEVTGAGMNMSCYSTALFDRLGVPEEIRMFECPN